METSNIVCGSNVYPCKENPINDQKFVNQIEDYELIKDINKKLEYGCSQVHLTEKQVQILNLNLRCVYAKNDPCWGYINGKGTRSKCIEGNCPHIKKCNPGYTPEQSKYWTMTEETKDLYGCPEKQKKYYLVDLVSDEEMSRYKTDPKGAGIEFPIIPEIQEEAKTKEKKLVIIGYEETYFGDADNQVSPIWGYVDDSEDGGQLVTNRYGSRKEIVHSNAHKMDEKPVTAGKTVRNEKPKPVKETLEIKAAPVINTAATLDSDKKLQYEETVKKNISGSYQITEITDELVRELSSGKILNIILSNEAEMAYVSSMLLKANILHDMELCDDGREKVCLWKAQTTDIKFSSGMALVSSTFVEQGCSPETEKAWSALNATGKISELIVSGRDFFEFKDSKNQRRWGCRNLYGATHIVVNAEDFELLSAVDGEQKVSLMKNGKNYMVLSKLNADNLGVTTEKFCNALECLKTSGEIPELPRLIADLVLAKTDNGYMIKGIGHMNFEEY